MPLPHVAGAWLMVLALALGTAEAGPLSASGADLLGTAAPPWRVVEWDGAGAQTLEQLRGRVVVVRFWTDTCPYCARTLPALQSLAEAHRAAAFVGIYHSKPRGTDRAWAPAVAKARALGVTFPLAYDRDWRTVDSWWLDERDGVPTSATFVVDAQGKIAYVHPGPELHPSDDADHAECDAAFKALRAAVEGALSRIQPR